MVAPGKLAGRRPGPQRSLQEGAPLASGIRQDGRRVSTAAATAQQKIWTIIDVLQFTVARFEARGILSPRLDAELLAAHALGLARVQLYAHFDRPLSPDELAALRELVRRRQGGEPVAYLTGKKEFWSLELQVDGRVLVPRPDTETLVAAALDRLVVGMPMRVVDVGTGSGAIALAIAKGRATATVFATDVSEDALAVARANADRLGVVVSLAHGDLLAPLADEAPFNIIVANLPYVRSDDIPQLAPEVRAEPRAALDGGADGLDIVRRLISASPPALVPGGWLLLEIGDGQATATVELCRGAGFDELSTCRDLGGIERVVAARKPGGHEH